MLPIVFFAQFKTIQIAYSLAPTLQLLVIGVEVQRVLKCPICSVCAQSMPNESNSIHFLTVEAAF